MLSYWRRRRARRRGAGGKQAEEDSSGMELTVPSQFLCPISLDLMKDPVTLSTGITYDRQSIETWIEGGNKTCPFTKQPLVSLESIPNHAIRKMIQSWCVENKSLGVERIPTPRIPVMSADVLDVLSKLEQSRDDGLKCVELVGKLKKWAKESDRSKRCIVENGAGHVLSSLFESFSEEEKRSVGVLEEIMSALATIFPTLDDHNVNSHLATTASLKCIVWFLKCGDLASRRNAILVLKRIVVLPKVAESLEGFESEDVLLRLIKEPICPASTKAALMVIYHMITSATNPSLVVSKFGELGLVSLLLEIIINSDKSICEKALGVLDAVCDCDEGREMACDHSLTVPVVIKKILRVSDAATEFSISVLWKLCRSEEKEGKGRGVVEEALEVGAFQKLLLLLQFGWRGGEGTKEKVSELLRLMNMQRGTVECVDSMDFKNLKRPF
ncbi:hypothetical protein Ancab_018355 [Ancistrocladus abbreviatus]